MFGADAAAALGRPLVDKGLDGGQEGGVFGRGGDVQVEVPVSWKSNEGSMEGTTRTVS